MHAPRRVIPTVFALLTVMAGCSSTGSGAPRAVPSAPARPCQSASPGAGPAKSDVPEPSLPAAEQVTTLGNALAIKGEAPGEQVTVTFLEVVDPACGVGGDSRLDSGMKYVGLKLRLVNSGQTQYEDAPGNCAWGWTDTGRQVGSYVFPTISAGPAIAPNGDLRLAPGQSATGYVVMEIPENARLTRIEFTPDSKFSDATGEWKLG
ncbi:hypothetical protein [Streptomyces sp. NPDC059708]|uniref:hypothetical protein n=1 Tax=Streptomyces sp. NPDC059708 TaxID=3346916 RepID=UPI003673DECE